MKLFAKGKGQPDAQGKAPAYSPIDRVGLLGLLDQVYSLRRQMRRLCDALEQQPPEVRDAIRRALPRAGDCGP